MQTQAATTLESIPLMKKIKLTLNERFFFAEHCTFPSLRHFRRGNEKIDVQHDIF